MLRFILHNYAPIHTPLKNHRSKPIGSVNFRFTTYIGHFNFLSLVLSVSSESSAAIGTSKRVFRQFRRSFLRPLLVSTTETNCYRSTSEPPYPRPRSAVTTIPLSFRHIYRPAAQTHNFLPPPPAHCWVAIHFARITKTCARAQWYRRAITAARINQTECSINYDFVNYSRAVNARVTC